MRKHTLKSKWHLLGAPLLALFAAVGCALGQATEPQHVNLWAEPVPFAKGDAAADKPWIDVYLPAANPTHSAVLVFPGGGYRYLATDHEGVQPAQWLVAHGVAAFVVHYRVAPYSYPVPLLDAVRALRLVRSRAAEFGIAPDHIGAWGFSAGGHVVSFLATHFDQPFPGAPTLPAPDAVDALSDRPDFVILAYPVVSMEPGITHPGSHDLLLAGHPDPSLVQALSNDRNVQPTSPPLFLMSTTDDPIVPVENSLRLYRGYLAQHLSVEMHLFDHGPHGIGLGQKTPGASAWPALLESWLTRHNVIATPSSPDSSTAQAPAK